MARKGYLPKHFWPFDVDDGQTPAKGNGAPDNGAPDTEIPAPDHEGAAPAPKDGPTTDKETPKGNTPM